MTAPQGDLLSPWLFNLFRQTQSSMVGCARWHKEADRISKRLFLANQNPCIRLLATDTRNGDVVPTDASGRVSSL